MKVPWARVAWMRCRKAKARRAGKKGKEPTNA